MAESNIQINFSTTRKSARFLDLKIRTIFERLIDNTQHKISYEKGAKMCNQAWFKLYSARIAGE
jgi:hypothetical protein